jgi:hypothetical protein
VECFWMSNLPAACRRHEYTAGRGDFIPQLFLGRSAGMCRNPTRAGRYVQERKGEGRLRQVNIASSGDK